jgi:hypothetical protein
VFYIMFYGGEVMARSIWGAVRIMMYEMTVLLPLLLVVLVGFLLILTWATAQSGAIPLGVNMGITNMLGISDLSGVAGSIPREFTTTVEIFGRGIAGLTIGF